MLLSHLSLIALSLGVSCLPVTPRARDSFIRPEKDWESNENDSQGLFNPKEPFPDPLQHPNVLYTPNPAFLNIFRNPVTNKQDMFISTFNMVKGDALKVIYNVGSVSTFSSEQVANIKSHSRFPLVWPNGVTQIDSKLFGVPGVLVSGGFLPPGKSDGGIWFSGYLADGSMGPLVNLKKSRGFFYHRTIVFDVNADGQPDLLTCKASKPMVGASSGYLVWLEPMDRRKPFIENGWNEHILATGCDVHFELADLDKDGIPEIIGTEFFSKHQLTLFYTRDPKGDFTKSIEQFVIDDSIGSPFDVQIVDLNNDGHPELLTSNHAKRGESPSPSVFVYEIPKEFKTHKWTRHTIISDIPVKQDGKFEAAPGRAQAFHPSRRISGHQRPYILVSGDGAQTAFYLVPNQGPGFSYTKKELYDCQSVVGAIDIADTDGDGINEAFIPCYYSGKIARVPLLNL